MSRAVLSTCLLLSLAAGTALAQDGRSVRAPLPPQRPFDLGLPGGSAFPPIVVAPAPALPLPAAPESSVTSLEPDEGEGPEWPKLTPGQKAGAEPQFDPEERPDQAGVSTDKGTSIACLPASLKGVLDKIALRFGSVKVTSTWRPLWRARRGSYHRRCEAMDFRVPGVSPRVVLDYARGLPNVGGNKVYWNGIIHIDTGPRRAW